MKKSRSGSPRKSLREREEDRKKTNASRRCTRENKEIKPFSVKGDEVTFLYWEVR